MPHSSEQSLKRCIRQQRSKMYPPNPVSLRDLVIPAPWTMTAGDRAERFLRYDTGPETENRLLYLPAQRAEAISREQHMV
ncbi:hypothetical protein HPB52_025229 [Rhipicephalus sanguineus]|uniref:Uncharacterized protein n=1 Tax=Rhipicephalus sanguineus TaxID=34632 RepID=A0A9D4PA46_RHISA|nr:hypothetical protein HPB52_025229 [Rhipicephalus sanguineus]